MNLDFIKEKLSLEGKKVFVSGASRGIGLATSIYLSHFGARVLGVARESSDLIKMQKSLFGNGHDWLSSDLSKKDGIDALINKFKTWGIPDIIIANLYIRNKPKKLIDLENNPELNLNENLDYLFKILPICLKEQRKKIFGRWIGISSMIATMGGPGQFQYSILKNSLQSLFQTIAIEEGKNGITANIISPGIINSPGTNSNYPKELLDTFSKMNLIGRAGTEEEIASAIGFLASPMSSYITGVNLPVCAGYNLSWGIQHALEGKLNL